MCFVTTLASAFHWALLRLSQKLQNKLGLKWPTILWKIHHPKDLRIQVDNFEPVFLSFFWSIWEAFPQLQVYFLGHPVSADISQIIRIFEYFALFEYLNIGFIKNEYYSLFVFVQFWFPNIIRYSYSSYFHYSLQHCVLIRLCVNQVIHWYIHSFTGVLGEV